jgi:hypothetical protein
VKYSLHHSTNLSSVKSGPTKYLFNHPAHLQLQSATGWHVFEYREAKTHKVCARFFFHLKKGEARSPLRAPFGSIELYRKLNVDQITDFVSHAVNYLKTLGAKTIVIRNAPELYYEKTSGFIKELFLNTGFEFLEEVSSIICVDEINFEQKIKISERQKLYKAANVFHFSKVNKLKLNELYKFIASCRAERQQSLSMTLAELKKLVTTFPNRLLFFRVGTETETVAAAIVIRVNKDVLYTFYYAHAKAHNRISPVVLLISGIYDFAMQHKYKMIDLGTSMIDGQINKSLLHFKKSIGAITNKKITFTRVLS